MCVIQYSTTSPVWKADGWGDDAWTDDAWNDDGWGPDGHKPTKKPTKKPTRKPSPGDPTNKPTRKPTRKPSPGTCPCPRGSVEINDDYADVPADQNSRIGVLANDKACGGNLKVTKAYAPDYHAKYLCRPTNNQMNVKFIPDDGFCGYAECTYEACDGSCCGTATVNLHVYG